MHPPFVAVLQAFRPEQGGQSEADGKEPASGGEHVAHTERNFSMWHIFISQGREKLSASFIPYPIPKPTPI